MRARTVDDLPVPARSTHVHDLCGHGCACYSPLTATCQKCRTAEANRRMDEAFRQKYPQPGAPS